MSHQNHAGAALKAVEPVNPNSLPGQVVQLRSNVSDLEREITLLRERLTPILTGDGTGADSNPKADIRTATSPLNEDLQGLNARVADACQAVEHIRHLLDL